MGLGFGGDDEEGFRGGGAVEAAVTDVGLEDGLEGGVGRVVED